MSAQPLNSNAAGGSRVPPRPQLDPHTQNQPFRAALIPPIDHEETKDETICRLCSMPGGTLCPLARCNVSFHSDCLRTWWRTSGRAHSQCCPSCKRDVYSREADPAFEHQYKKDIVAITAAIETYERAVPLNVVATFADFGERVTAHRPLVPSKIEKTKRSAMKSLEKFEKIKRAIREQMQELASIVDDISEKNYLLRVARAPGGW